MKKTSPMRKLYDSRLFWMIVSFLAALAMWVYFSSTDAEEMTKIFRGVRVELNRITLDVTPAVPSPLERHLDDAQSLPS